MHTTAAPFTSRHVGPDTRETREMLASLGLPSLETLIAKTVPAAIRLGRELDIPNGIGEHAALAELAAKFDGVPRAKALIGQGYHGTLTPPVIQRNLFENPAWYTSYTPYQPEISQGRLEMLFHFQTLVTELTGLPVASRPRCSTRRPRLPKPSALRCAITASKRHKIIVANTLHPQIARRAEDPRRAARHERSKAARSTLKPPR